MDRSANDDPGEPPFRLSSSSSSPALAYLGARKDDNSHSQGFDFSAQDVLSGFDFHASLQPRRQTFSGANVSSRRHGSFGSSGYLTRELTSAKKDAEMDYHGSKIATAVDRAIKEHADNILGVLEVMNGRLANLESLSQALGNSVASLKTLVEGYHGEADARLKALNSHVSEVHQAVQILRDKQDIVETSAELAKLQASKAEAICEKVTKQPVASSQSVTQEQRTVLSNLAPKRYSTELQVSGQLQQLSASVDVNALPQPIHTQGGHVVQPIQALSQPELSCTFQPLEKVQAIPGAFQAQAEHVESRQFVPLQQGTFQVQPQHMQSMFSVQLQHKSSQAQQKQAYNRQSAQSQERASQAQQQHVWVEQALLFQQGAFQAPAHRAQPQEAPRGVLQAQSQHVQMQQSAQSQQQTQQYVQSEQGVFQAQSQQQAQAHQSFQAHQGPLQFKQGVVIPAQPQQAQTKQIFQPHQSNLPTQLKGAQMMVQPPHTQQASNPHLPLQGGLPEQSSFPFTQQNESLTHAPLSQAISWHSPCNAGPYDVSYTGSSQQHSFSGLPIPPAQLSNAYHRFPSPSQAPQLVYASQMARPAVSSATADAGALPIAPRSGYDQRLAGRPANLFLR